MIGEELVCVCQNCGKDMGLISKPKEAVYKEKGGWYCEGCYAKKDRQKHR